MAKKIVRYLLEGNGSIPVFIENGGYLCIDEEMVGLSVDENRRHVPSTVIRMSKEDLKARAIQMALDEQGQYRINPRTGIAVTQAEVYAQVDDLLAMLGVPDYE